MVSQENFQKSITDAIEVIKDERLEAHSINKKIQSIVDETHKVVKQIFHSEEERSKFIKDQEKANKDFFGNKTKIE